MSSTVQCAVLTKLFARAAPRLTSQSLGRRSARKTMPPRRTRRRLPPPRRTQRAARAACRTHRARTSERHPVHARNPSRSAPRPCSGPCLCEQRSRGIAAAPRSARCSPALQVCLPTTYPFVAGRSLLGTPSRSEQRGRRSFEISCGLIGPDTLPDFRCTISHPVRLTGSVWCAPGDAPVQRRGSATRKPLTSLVLHPRSRPVQSPSWRVLSERSTARAARKNVHIGPPYLISLFDALRTLRPLLR